MPPKISASYSKYDVQQQALDHAWAWFSYHATQRVQSVNLFLVAVAFVVAGYGVAYTSDNYVLAGVVSIAGLAISIAFWLLEVRNRELVRAAEDALDQLEERLAKQSGVKSIRFVRKVSAPSVPLASYSFVIRGLVVLGLLLSFAGGVGSIVGAVNSGNSGHHAQNGHHTGNPDGPPAHRHRMTPR